MAEAFEEMQGQNGTADLTHAEWLGLLIDREAASRETKRFESRIRTALPATPHGQMDTRQTQPDDYRPLRCW